MNTFESKCRRIAQNAIGCDFTVRYTKNMLFAGKIVEAEYVGTRNRTAIFRIVLEGPTGRRETAHVKNLPRG